MHLPIVSHSLQMQTNGEAGFGHARHRPYIIMRRCYCSCARLRITAASLFPFFKKITCSHLLGGGGFNTSVEIILLFTSYNGFKD